MNSLLNISNEEIRKNWPNYENDVEIDSPLYDILWNNLCEKQGLDHNDEKVAMLRTFIDSNKQKMTLPKMTKTERAEMHELCDKVGLYHMSYGRKPRLLRITKPPVWKWEFTEENPEAREKREEYERKEAKKERKMRNMCCDWCGANALEKDLLCSVYFSGICCEECAGEVSDGNGGTLDCHKLESADFMYR